MDFISDSILIIPNSLKNTILKTISGEKKNIKLISMDEFIKMATFSYDEQTILYVINKYNVSYKVALKYLDNLKYIENKKYNSKKIQFLKELKEELLNESLLIIDPFFDNYIKNKDIFMFGYTKINKFYKKIIDKYNIKVVSSNNTYSHDIYEFKNIEDEIEFVFEKICELINNGVSINNIKIANYNSDYTNILKRMSRFYNLNIAFESDSIYSTLIIKDFFNNLNTDINVTLNVLKEKYDLDNIDNLYIYNSIIKVLNKYYFVDNYLLIKDVLIDEFKKIKNKNIKYKNSIELINVTNNVIYDYDYVFLIGFNQGLLPKIYKDEDYLSDKEKEELDIETSYMLNELEKNSVLSFINNTKNLIISYKLSSFFNSYYKSYLIDELPYKITVNPKLNRQYSNLMNKINLSKDLDNYTKYNEVSDRLITLNSNYDINYKSYNNKYKNIKTNSLENYLKNTLVLSYSSMNDYYKCSFRYYLKNILKIDKYEETLDTIIGSLFHYILSICFNSDLYFEKEYNDYLKKYNLDAKSKFYINKLKSDLLLIIKTIKEQYTHMSFDKALYEEEFYINFDGNIKITFKGFIDKILYKEENNKTYLVIVDYKTGGDTIKINNSIYGLDLQLPVYLYLAKNANKLKNVEVLGFYLQKLLDQPSKSKESIIKSKQDNLKLQGYTISDEKLIGIVDDTYENSEIISSLKMTNNGFYAYSKVLTKENINNLYDLTEKKIINAIDSIRKADFSINPKKVGDKLVGCEYCKYKDICYKNNDDIVNLEEIKDLSFLGGEKNA